MRQNAAYYGQTTFDTMHIRRDDFESFFPDVFMEIDELYVNNTSYSFELNYYCENKIEFLFSLKVFSDVEISINNLVYELININVLKNQ